MIETVRNVTNAGVVAVISAGNDRDDYGLGSAGSPGTAPDAISVAAVSNGHVYAAALDVVESGAPVSLRGLPFLGAAGQRAPVAWGQRDQTLVDVGSIAGTDGAPVGRRLCGPPSNPNGGRSTLPGGSLAGAIALVRRGECTFVSKVARARAAGAAGVIFVDNRPGEANTVPVAIPGAGMIADADGDRLQAYLATRGGRAPGTRGPHAARADDGSQRRRDELLLRRADRLRPPPQAGRGSAGRADPLLDAARAGRAVRGLRRHEHGGAARRRRGRGAGAAPPRLDDAAGQVRADVHGGHGLGGHGPNERGIRAARRQRARGRRRGRHAARLHGSRLALVRRPRRDARATSTGRCC